jgi:hypothetical protein
MLNETEILTIFYYSLVCFIPILLIRFFKKLDRFIATATFVIFNFIISAGFIFCAHTGIFSGPENSIFIYFLDWSFVQESFFFLALVIAQVWAFSFAFNFFFSKINYYSFFRPILFLKNPKTGIVSKVSSGLLLNVSGIVLILSILTFYIVSKGGIDSFFGSGGTRFLEFLGESSGKLYTLLNLIILAGTSCLATSTARGNFNVVLLGIFGFLGSLNSLVAGERFAVVNFILMYLILIALTDKSRKISIGTHIFFILAATISYTVVIQTRHAFDLGTALFDSIENITTVPLTIIDVTSPLPALTFSRRILPEPAISTIDDLLVFLPRILIWLSPFPSSNTLLGETSFQAYDFNIFEGFNVDVFAEVALIFGWWGTTFYGLLSGFVFATIDTVLYSAFRERKLKSLVFSPIFFLVPLSGIWFSSVQNVAPVRASTRMFIYLVTLVILRNIFQQFVVRKRVRQEERDFGQKLLK